MTTRRIGSLDVSVVGIGCNNFGRRLDATATANVVNAALDNGITLFDTADVYGGGLSEEYIGRALGKRRNEAIIATKFGNTMEGQGRGAHPDYIKVAVDASLRRLSVDVIDLYQLHVPDPDAPIADTLGALNDLVQAGKVREVGASNFSAKQIREAEDATGGGAARFVSIQNRFSVLHREPLDDGVLEVCGRLGLGFLPYFPLESGLLTGKYRAGQPRPAGTRLADDQTAERFEFDAKIVIAERLIDYAEARGHTILELAFGWLLTHDVVSSVIAGATKPEQITANAAATAWTLTSDEVAEIGSLLIG